jgi:hypothetical protein
MAVSALVLALVPASESEILLMRALRYLSFVTQSLIGTAHLHPWLSDNCYPFGGGPAKFAHGSCFSSSNRSQDTGLMELSRS